MSLRLFLSADLAGSTAFKQNHSSAEWQLFFRGFYEQLPAYVDKHFAPGAHRPHLWKTIGDEIVFTAPLTRANDVPNLLTGFRRGVAEYRQDITQPYRRLDLKCAAWTAGFPVGNLEVPLPGQPHQVDFIGPGMDIGFRLVKEASPRHLVLSVELTYILTLAGLESVPIFMGPSVELKGVGKGHPYPSLWIDNFLDACCTGWDRLELEEEQLRGASSSPADPRGLHAFCGNWLHHMGDPWMIPFIEGDPQLGTMPPHYPEVRAALLNSSQNPSTTSSDEQAASKTGARLRNLKDFLPVRHAPADPPASGD